MEIIQRTLRTPNKSNLKLKREQKSSGLTVDLQNKGKQLAGN